MTRLREVMLEELQRRNFAQTTLQYYLKAVEDFALHFGKPPDQLNGDHLRQYQVYLLNERKLQPRTARLHVCALRFFFIKTLKRRLPLDDIPYPKAPRRLPIILTVEEVARLIDSAHNLLDRTMLMALYSTGMRNREMRYLQVKDIDSKSMLIHIQYGKGGRDRYVPLSPTLLETLREYWRWMRPKTWLFPGTIHNWSVPKIWHTSISRHQSLSVRESREASRLATIPTSPNATELRTRSNPSRRAEAIAALDPRSQATTSTSFQPRTRIRSAKSY